MFNRQKMLLQFLDALGGRVRTTDFQKLLFLYCHEVEDSPSYNFVPYRYGSFSFTCYADWRKLIRSGLLEDNDGEWILTERGERAVSQFEVPRNAIREFCQNMTLRKSELIAHVYRKHPYFAINSEIKQDVGLSASELGQIEASRPQEMVAGLLTIGYEGRSLEQYLNLLIQASVSLLCDVRRNPISRKYGFSKGTLSNACQNLGIAYEHIPSLGIASANRRQLKTSADYRNLFDEYTETTLPERSEELVRIRQWIRKGKRVALTCFEHQPHQCHRHCVAHGVERISPGVYTEHL